VFSAKILGVIRAAFCWSFMAQGGFCLAGTIAHLFLESLVIDKCCKAPVISEYQCSVCTAGHSHTKSIGLSPVSPEKWHFLWGIPRFQISPCWSAILTSWYQQSHGRPTMLVVQWKICVKSTFIDIEERYRWARFTAWNRLLRTVSKGYKTMFPKGFPNGPSSLGSKGLIWGKRYGRW